MKQQLFPMTKISTRVRLWLMAVLASVVIVGFGYVAVQQNYRLSANDPLVQNAELIKSYLSAGAQADQLSNGSVDPSKSLNMFFAVADDKQKLLGGSLQVNGSTPLPPKGVFEAAKKNGTSKVTWAPAKGVRTAIVVTHYTGTKSGYVIVGTSLKEVEQHVNQLTLMAGATLALLVVISTAAVWLVGSNNDNNRPTGTLVAAATPAATLSEMEVAAVEAPIKKKITSKSTRTKAAAKKRTTTKKRTTRSTK
jgi:sensor histidine kinase regulating citrate/malate metabolism